MALVQYESLRSMFFGGDGSLERRPYHAGSEPETFGDGEWMQTMGWRDGKFSAQGHWWVEDTVPFMAKHYEIPILLGLAYYLFVVVFLQRFMKDREPFSLAPLLSFWNFLLAAGSIWGSVILLPDMVERIRSDGDLSHDLCDMKTEYLNPVVFLFCLSKIPEFVDTVFLALRKRPIIFLHWYHHIATAIYCWDSWANGVSAGGWFAAMNLVVHSIMYSYYLIMSLVKWRAPGFVAISITSLQIIQMLGGLAILFFALQNCPTSVVAPDGHVRRNLYAGILMYFSYAALFINFFLQRYLFKKHPKATPAQQAQAIADAKVDAKKKAKKID